MADNFETNAASGGAIFASDDIAGVHYPILKLAFGALDAAVLAIAGAGNVTAGTQRVTLADNDPAVVDLAAIEVLLTALNGYVDGLEALLATSNTNTGNAATSLGVMDDWDNAASDGASVSGDTAHDAADAGEPVKIGGYAKAAAPSDVSADADRVNAWFLLNGAQAVAVTAAGALIGGDAANGLDVDVTRSALPTGAATSAKQDTIIGHVDGIETLLTAIDGHVDGIEGTQASIVTSVQLIDDVVLAEDVAHQDGDKGVMALAVRDDTLNARSGTENDYEPLHTNANGALWTADVNSASALTSLQLIDDPVIADDAAFTPATSKVMMAGFEFDDSSPDSVDEGDAGAARMSARREIYTQIRDAAGNERGANVNASGQLAVAGPVTNAGTFAVQASEADGANVTLGAKTDAKSTATDATSITVMQVLKQISASVQAPPSQAVTNAGTFAVQIDAGAVTSLALIDDPVIADDAAFTPATSKVMMAGFEADESSTDSVDEGDAGAARMTLDRKQIVTLQPHTAGGATTFMASGSDGSSILVATKQTIKASAGQIYGYYAFNPEAATTFVHFYNTDTVTVGTTNPQMSIAIPAGSAANLTLPFGILFDTAISCSATTTAGGNGAPATGVSLVVWYK